MSDTSLVYLTDRKSGKLVEASLIDGLTREDVEKASVAVHRSRAMAPGGSLAKALARHTLWNR
jgi:hypothetical protein